MFRRLRLSMPPASNSTSSREMLGADIRLGSHRGISLFGGTVAKLWWRAGVLGLDEIARLLGIICWVPTLSAAGLSVLRMMRRESVEEGDGDGDGDGDGEGWGEKEALSIASRDLRCPEGLMCSSERNLCSTRKTLSSPSERLCDMLALRGAGALQGASALLSARTETPQFKLQRQVFMRNISEPTHRDLGWAHVGLIIQTDFF